MHSWTHLFCSKVHELLVLNAIILLKVVKQFSILQNLFMSYIFFLMLLLCFIAFICLLTGLVLLRRNGFFSLPFFTFIRRTSSLSSFWKKNQSGLFTGIYIFLTHAQYNYAPFYVVLCVTIQNSKSSRILRPHLAFDKRVSGFYFWWEFPTSVWSVSWCRIKRFMIIVALTIYTKLPW